LLEGFGGFVSLAVLIFLLTSTDRKSNLNRLFTRLVLCNIAAVLCDALAWAFNGGVSAHAYIIVRAAKFMAYSLSYLLIPILTDYAAALIGRYVKVSRNIPQSMYALFGAAVLMLVISQFNNMYYFFDENNLYQVREMFWLSQAVGILFMGVCAAAVLRYWRNIHGSDRFFLLSYGFFPLLAMAVHSFALQNFEILFIATTLSILFCYGGIQARQAKLLKDNELKLTESRIAVMLSQIQPHFLYNSLVVIRQLCRIDPKLAEETVVEFADYLRGNLDSLTINGTIPFERELHHVQNYLSIEKKRFGDKLNIKYDVGFKNFMLPALTLQPIVENAVRHGVTKKERGGTVTVTTGNIDGNAIITVTDDGAGFDPSVPPNQDGRSHMGIGNVRSRLAVMCGGTLEIQSKHNAGTTAVIIIPIYSKGEDNA